MTGKEEMMKKCIKITCTLTSTELKEGLMRDVVQEQARALGLEGSAQMVLPNSLKIIVYGEVEAVDSLLDILHKESSKYAIDAIEVEPMIKDRDFRGIFRVIE
jgi:acylphosphatase